MAASSSIEESQIPSPQSVEQSSGQLQVSSPATQHPSPDAVAIVGMDSLVYGFDGTVEVTAEAEYCCHPGRPDWPKCCCPAEGAGENVLVQAG